MAGETILIIDDEKEICDLIESYLVKEGFASVAVATGAEGLAEVAEKKPALIILDYNLPDIEGPELCLEIRKITNAPVLFLSCRSDEIDKVISLSSGADDYITKPFMPAELIARIKANLRRCHLLSKDVEDDTSKEIAGLVIDPHLRTVHFEGELIPLTAKEYDILFLLAENPKRIYSADQLFQIVWKSGSVGGDSKTVSVHISSLRKKLDVTGRDYIVNIRSIGYKFNHTLLEAGN